jgi:hypothetical protein
MHSLSRFPKFELSYETVHHKKVCASDSIAIACPIGKKYFVWFIDQSCYLVDLNKDKVPIGLTPLSTKPLSRHKFGTVIYGTDVAGVFVVEDIYVSQGVPLSNLCFGDRIGFLREFILDADPNKFVLPCMAYKRAGQDYDIEIGLEPEYPLHHVQYREIGKHAPYINVLPPRKGIEPKKQQEPKPLIQIPKFDYGKPQFRQPAVFQVVADVQFDIYHAYAYPAVYCGPLGIPNYKTSVFMNGIFRKIRENANLDYIEESDDEDDFENTDETKYVDLDKVVKIECTFHSKFKKWVPVRIVGENAKIVPIGKLANQK